MKNVLLSFTIALLLLNGRASAQILTQTGKDTAMAAYSSGPEHKVHHYIKPTGATMTIRWNVASATFGTGWSDLGSGVCDNNTCYTATSGNNIFTNASVKTTSQYDNSGYHDFYVVFNTANNPANNSMAVVRVNAQDMESSTNRTLTFIAYKGSLGVSTFSSSDDVVLFPNPARDAVNVYYDEKTDVKTIAVYNLIGKLMGPIYRPSSNGSAKIDLDNMPSGIYFLRMMDSQGHVVATRRFTRQ